ncbi:hypothetical protein NTGZN8_180059 [Candidatus Nitrotoga fabula]|uniref:Uncharacterized protein n=1 Tax=Candidatus Nitrotoga fabula TaxID=2182327 RepID=A0A916F9G4_9PROT|nr:hypothetical protein NTGZN8_180059 [Candidatus Nitrotoga fabula]
MIIVTIILQKRHVLDLNIFLETQSVAMMQHRCFHGFNKIDIEQMI